MAEPTRSQKYDTKRCPECRTHLPAAATKCTACGQKVGEATPSGIAKKPVDWVSYVSLFLALVA
ncbi:MAG: hypothetical protein ABII68_02580, partial [Pseudomonadota bacterium]